MLLCAASAWADISSVIVFPDGTNGDIQFNKNKRFGADTGTLTYSTSTKRLSVPGIVFSTMTVNGQTYIFPVSQSGGTFLQTDGAGNLSWATPSGGSSGTGDSTLTVLDGEDIISFPTSALQFNEVQFTVSLTGGTTAAISLDPTLVTLLGPTIDLGSEVVGSLPASLIAAGSLGSGVIASSIAVNSVTDSAIVGVSGSKVSGNIVGNAAGITGTVNVSQVIGAVSVYAATATASFPYGLNGSTIALSNSSANYGMVITSTGTKNGLRVVEKGFPDSAYQSLDGGAVNIQVSEDNFPVPALVLVSSNTDGQVGAGILEIWNESVNHNDPHLWLHAKDNNSAGNIRIDSRAPNVEIVNTSTDNVHGFGKWEPFAAAYQSARMQVASSRCYDNSGFNNLAYWEPMSKGGGLYLQPFDSTGCEATAGVGTSSATIPIAWTTLNAHTVGLRGPYNTTASWNFTLPSTFNNGGQVLAQQVGNGLRNWEFTTGGTAGQVLTFVSTSAVPTWAAASGGGGVTVYAATATASFPFGYTASTATFGSITSTALGTNPWVSINSSGTSSALTVTGYGQPSGLVQQANGLVNIIQPLGTNASAALVIVDSVTETQTGEGLFEIWEKNPNHNDPLIWIHNDSSNSAPIFRMDDPQPDFELVNTSTDNTHGMGKWEPFASPNLGTQLQVNSRAYDNSTFERVAEWRMRQKGTALALYPTILAENGNPTATSAAQIIWISTNSSREWGMKGPQSPSASFYITWPGGLPSVGSLLYMTEAAGERKMAWTPVGTTGQCLKFNLGSAPTWETCSSGAGSTYSIQYKDSDGNLAGSGYFVDINQQQLLVGTTTGAEGAIGLQEAAANGSSYVALKASASLAGSTTWILPPADGSAGDVLSTLGNVGGVHNLAWATPTGTPSGGSRAVQYKSGSSFGGSGKILISANDDLQMQTSAQLQLYQGDNAHYVGFRAQDSGLAGSTIWQLPVTAGTTGQVLTNGGTGDSYALFWNTPAGGPDSFGSHTATKTVTADYGIHTTTVTATAFDATTTSFTVTGTGGIRNVFGITTTTMTVSTITFSASTIGILRDTGGTKLFSYPGTSNTFFGYGSAANVNAGTVGIYNTCFGDGCMATAPTGSINTAIGKDSMKSITSGSNNMAGGYESLAALTSGKQNTGYGRGTLAFTTTGENNTAVGYLALGTNGATKSGNVAVGGQALELTIASSNTAVGYLAGETSTIGNENQTGEKNTYIGALSGQSTAGAGNTYNNSIALGYSALIDASNQAQIGGTAGSGNEVRLRVASATVQGELSATSFTGSGLSTCGDATHALAWSSSDNKFTCQSVTGSGGGGGGDSFGTHTATKTVTADYGIHTTTITATAFDETTTSMTITGASGLRITALSASLPVKTDANKGLTAAAIDLSGSEATGTMAAARMPALTGDVTTVAGAVATTLASTIANPHTFSDSITIASATVSGVLGLTVANLARFNGGVFVSTNPKNASYTVTGTDSVILASGTSNGVTITLPNSSVNYGQVIQVSKVSMSTYPITVQAAVGDFIGGSTGTIKLNAYGQTATMIASGGLWLPWGAGIQQTPAYVGNGLEGTTANAINVSSMVMCNAFTAPVPVLISSLTVQVGAIVTGNNNQLDMGIYDTLGNRLGSTGNTACTVGRYNAPLSAPLNIPAGVYYMCIVTNNVTNTFFSATQTTHMAPGTFAITGAPGNIPLPATLTFPGTASRLVYYNMWAQTVGGGI